MSKIRKAARGRECMVRVPEVCNGDPATTVLAHYRSSRWSGIGQKPDDAIGAWACSACHDAIDGRTRTKYDREVLRHYHAEGVMATFAQLRQEGLL